MTVTDDKLAVKKFVPTQHKRENSVTPQTHKAIAEQNIIFEKTKNQKITPA